MSGGESIVLAGVSKYYGEVLGVNRVDLSLPSGITALVGPNGSGKTTLLNLITGLLKPTQGEILVRGVPPSEPQRLGWVVGYCPQYDSFPPGESARRFLISQLRLYGWSQHRARETADETLDRVGLSNDGDRKIAGFSKGMRQRLKLGLSMAHQPPVLVLDEPLNGLDPLARAELMGLFREHGQEGRHLVISSHILHEVDVLADQVVLLNHGYVMAEGEISDVRGEMTHHPIQITLRCSDPSALAARLFSEEHVVEVRLHSDRSGLVVLTEDADSCYRLLNQVVSDGLVEILSLAPLDEDVEAVYQYLVGQGGEVL